MYKNKRCYDGPINPANGNMNTMNQNEYPAAGAGAVGGAGFAGMPNQMDPRNMGCQMQPIYECPQERVCHKEFVHEVPQDYQFM